MPKLSADTSFLLMIDFQARLMPAIDQGAAVVDHARRLIKAAALVDVPFLFTEQNAKGLGPTLAELVPESGSPILHKMSFDAVCAPGLSELLPPRSDVIVAGCEAHVCVLQTVLGLIEAGRRVFVVRDAIGSRRPESKETAVQRMERHGAEIVTAEMVVFEWLGTADHPRFREVVALVK
jgi:nicotinamidase-related amidase